MRLMLIATAVALSLLAGSIARGDWQEPADGAFTEAEFVNYCAAVKEWRATNEDSGKPPAGASGIAGAVAAVLMDEKFTASLAHHQLGEAEFAWVNAKAIEVMANDQVVQAQQKAQETLAAEIKNADDQKAAQAKIDAYTTALANGAWVKTPDEVNQIAGDAKTQQQQSLDEAKTHGDEAKAAGDEAKQHDDEANAAAALAANPPADIAPDDRAAYIEARKADVQTAMDAAAEARTRQSDALKAQQEAETAAQSAGERASHPDVPATDDEKAQAKAADQAALTDAQQELDSLKKQAELMQRAVKTTGAFFGAQLPNVPKANVDIFHKHQQEFSDAWGMGKN